MCDISHRNNTGASGQIRLNGIEYSVQRDLNEGSFVFEEVNESNPESNPRVYLYFRDDE